MSTQHTPGPWRSNDFSSSVYGYIFGDSQAVCRVFLDGDECEANARLIAAAPDLLGALQSMVDGDSEAIEQAEALGVPFPAEMLTAYIKARAAIAKALGEKI